MMKVKKANQAQSFINRLKKEKELWGIAGLALVWIAIFSYYPMYGLIYSLFDYYPGMNLDDADFVGLKHFIGFFKLPDVWLILRNTVCISLLNMTIGFVCPIILALLITEVGNSIYRRTIQTITYLPYFVSWVVVASLVFSMLGGDGLVNRLLLSWGIIEHPIGFITEGKMFWGLLLGTNIWKNVGYKSIIYVSAITGIDQELYQAGKVDGLNRFGMVWHITIPGIMPTILLLFILGLGGILSAGFEQQLLLGTPQTRDYYEVIDTYVYRYGIQLGNYSFATAVGLMQSVIGLVLVIISNRISRRVTDMSIF